MAGVTLFGIGGIDFSRQKIKFMVLILKNMRPILFSCFLLFVLNQVEAQSTHAPLRKGDRAYDRVQYKEAEKHYRIAADHEVGNPKAVYNLGNTLYQQGKFEDAAQLFEQVASATQPLSDQADARHNLGDAFLKQRKYKEAVQAYEESLRLRPADPGTKQNLQMAKKRLREADQKEKEQQQKNQEQQQQQNQDQNQPPQQKPQNQQDKPQEQPSQPQQNQQGQPQKPSGEEQKKQMEQRLKKEDAKRLLETAVGTDDRKNAQKYRAAQQQTKPKGSKKDW